MVAGCKPRTHRLRRWLAPSVLVVAWVFTSAATADTILFVGNSFFYGAGSPVKQYGVQTVTDLNGTGFGGVPALFKAFADKAGLQYVVSLETVPGANFDLHYTEKRTLLDASWDCVVMSGHSTLDRDQPGDSAKLVRYAGLLAEMFHSRNPDVQVYLNATWPRADQTYLKSGHWYGKPITAMANDVRAGYDLATTQSMLIKGVIPTGQSWIRAMDTGVADSNPYDGIPFGKIDLWTHDQYHASSYGYYLEALMIFGRVTGRDPLTLGQRETAADALGLSPDHVQALQRVARDELVASGMRFP
jgi:hypothetical protein